MWVSRSQRWEKDHEDLRNTGAAEGGRFHIPRSRGAASGLLLVLLGLWGALIPFIGPYFDFAYSPDRPWVWTDARGWLEVLPGAVAVLGGLILIMTRNRATATFGGWLAVAAGVWFIVGRAFAMTLNIGEIGVPAAATPAKTVALELAYFSALGAFVVFLAPPRWADCRCAACATCSTPNVDSRSTTASPTRPTARPW